MASNAVKVWNEYATAWTNVSDQERRQILDRVLTANLAYSGPTGVSAGHEGVIKDIEGIQAKVPGGKFVARSAYAHHDVALIEWQLILPDGTADAIGYDSIRLSAEGKIESIVWFSKDAAQSPSGF
ncbi:hypothetical protein HDF16_002973 [Granulicella aggregans]|uniref:SnoaL-like protein n=1 Tax=Granulicella aggregans TaxID=474949 RepID=A0A7W7ZEQ7_9BACT|nr:hypothetical protein [Granulicella aggregans]MBB5058259.1 hypothetical protein [Granulicella aggregans]